MNGAVRYSGVVVDLDGVCYRGQVPLPGSREAIEDLRRAGIGIVYATNNATYTPGQAAEKLRALGFDAAPEEVVTSAVAAADMLEPGSRCLVVGMQGLRDAIQARGCSVVDDLSQVQVVVAGLDRELTYQTLERGSRALLAGARFIASNIDGSYPAADGISPGAGAIVAALEKATGRTAEVAGKPQPALFEAAAARLPDGPLLMIGDRVETDIHGAAALGWDTALVLTGVTTAEGAKRADPAPTYVADDLAAVVRTLLTDA